MDYKSYQHKLSKELRNAIVFFHHSKKQEPWKYRGISNKAKFEAFCRSHDALYINYYFKENNAYECRVWLKDYTKKEATV